MVNRDKLRKANTILPLLQMQFLLLSCGHICGLGKAYLEARAVSGFASHTHCTAVSINNLGDNRQSQPDTGFLGGEERIENLLSQVSGNSRPSIFNLHDHLMPHS